MGIDEIPETWAGPIDVNMHGPHWAKESRTDSSGHYY